LILEGYAPPLSHRFVAGALDSPLVSEDGQDRRGEPRVPIELKVEYKRLNSFFADYTRNISRGGTFIRTSKPLDIGTEFLFRMTVPKLPEPLVLRGRVQWIIKPEQVSESTKEPGMGIGFLYDSEADRQRIRVAVEQLMIESLGPVLYEKIMKRADD
jgi:type IV pilus assembly protein PilZ